MMNLDTQVKYGSKAALVQILHLTLVVHPTYCLGQIRISIRHWSQIDGRLPYRNRDQGLDHMKSIERKADGECIGGLSGDAGSEVRVVRPTLSGEPMTRSTTCTVYFDGACPVCRGEIAHYRRQRGSESIAWVDASNCDEAELGPGWIDRWCLAGSTFAMPTARSPRVPRHSLPSGVAFRRSPGSRPRVVSTGARAARGRLFDLPACSPLVAPSRRTHRCCAHGFLRRSVGSRF